MFFIHHTEGGLLYSNKSTAAVGISTHTLETSSSRGKELQSAESATLDTLTLQSKRTGLPNVCLRTLLLLFTAPLVLLLFLLLMLLIGVSVGISMVTISNHIIKIYTHTCTFDVKNNTRE